jgi:RNA polymerase sigma factor (sigma-70 family)
MGNDMANSRVSEVFQHLRRAVLLRDGAGLTDGQLLEDYIRRHDEAALAALVRRHGPMVWGVCRRILHNHHDAEDAFQATFLVLVRKAALVVPREMVANWLYGVAHQTALKARATTAKRRARERQVTQMPEPAVTEPDLWHDLQPLLDQELNHLPDIYRVAIVLCDLEGKTRNEAARQLGVPEGTLAARLARGRGMLAKRLARHGLAVSGGSLAAVLAQNAASSGVPTSVVASTIRAVTLVAARGAVGSAVSAKVAALTEGVVKAMLLRKLTIAAAALLAVAGLVALGIGQLEGPPLAARPQDPPTHGTAAPTKDQAKNATTWQAGATWEGHVDQVNRLAFSPDGKTLVSTSDDSTVKVWNRATGKERVSLQEPDGGGVRGLAFAPDGKTFATAGGDKRVRLWDAEQGTQLQQFGGHTAATYSVVFTPDGKTLVSGGGCANYPDKGQTGYGEIRFWDPATGKERTSVQSHTWPVAHLAFTPDGKTLISGGYDNTIKFWDWDGKAQPQERLTIAVGQGQGIYGMALSPDGKTLAVASEGTVKLWDVATGTESNTALEKSEYRDGYLWLSVAFAPDGKTVAASSPIQEWEDKDKQFVVQRRSDIMLWDVATGKLGEKLRVDEAVTSLTFAPDGKSLVTGCKGKMRMPNRLSREEDIETEKRGVVKLWELKKGAGGKKEATSQHP